MALDLYTNIIKTQDAINILLKGGKVETKPQVIDGGILYRFTVYHDGIPILLYSSTDIIQFYSYVKAFKDGVEVTTEMAILNKLKGENVK